MKAKFKPHNLDPSALEATATTLESLHRAGKITRDDDGGILVKDGWIEMTAEDAASAWPEPVHDGSTLFDVSSVSVVLLFYRIC